MNIAVRRHTLANGLDVLLHEDRSCPIVAVNVWYHVGSKNETPGHTGFAHLFEHLMFQGSAHIAKAEHGQLVERAGGSLNANTQYDITRYYNVVPSNRVNLALWLEAERMRSLAVTDENLKNQVAAVKEERRLRVDNAPYGKAIWEAPLAMFDAMATSEGVPLQRFGRAHELARPLLFLLSDMSSYMTGQVLHPNGGEIVNT